MKKTILLLSLIGIVCAGMWGCSKSVLGQMTKMENGVYIDSGEMTIGDWIEYDWDLKRDKALSHEEYTRLAMPDSVIFLREHNVAYSAIRQAYPYYRQYEKLTMVGLSHEQCLAYCRWRTKKYNMIHPKQVTFSLPTTAMLKRLAEKKSAKGDPMGDYSSDGNPSAKGMFRCVATAE